MKHSIKMYSLEKLYNGRYQEIECNSDLSSLLDNLNARINKIERQSFYDYRITNVVGKVVIQYRCANK